MEERHISPYLIKDLEAKLRTHDLFSWIDEEGERLALFGLTQMGSVEFTDELKHERNIVILPGNIIKEDASIRPEKDYYIIYYKKDLPSHRKRFAIAHEIGHTYWFAPGKGERPLSSLQLNVADPNIEYLCDRFAAALLLPRKHFSHLLEQRGFFNDPIIPPLHLIPQFAKVYSVADQAVARRIFFQLFPRKLAILCIRKEISFALPLVPTDQKKYCWKVSWCALPAELQQRESIDGIKIPLKTSARIIPEEMIPKISEGGTKAYALDGRWWDGIQGQPKLKSKITFKRLPPKNPKEGYASLFGDRIYIALPF